MLEVHILGPYKSGKTTLLKLLYDFLKKNGYTITAFDESKEVTQFLEKMELSPSKPIYPSLTIKTVITDPRKVSDFKYGYQKLLNTWEFENCTINSHGGLLLQDKDESHQRTKKPSPKESKEDH